MARTTLTIQSSHLFSLTRKLTLLHIVDFLLDLPDDRLNGQLLKRQDALRLAEYMRHHVNNKGPKQIVVSFMRNAGGAMFAHQPSLFQPVSDKSQAIKSSQSFS
jgi:hypothetical protein